MIHEVSGCLVPFAEIWSRLSGMYDLSEMDELVSFGPSGSVGNTERVMQSPPGVRLRGSPKLSQDLVASTRTIQARYKLHIGIKRKWR